MRGRSSGRNGTLAGFIETEHWVENMVGKRLVLVVALAVATAGFSSFGAPGRAAAAEATSLKAAAQFIDDLGSAAIAILSDQNGSLEAREAKVRALLREGLDLRLLGRFVLGKWWRRATPEQRNEYQRLFAEYLTQTYARRLAAYKGEKFTITDTRPIADTDAIVLTTIARPSGPPLKAGWRVRAKGGTHKIVDVVVEGVSMAVAQRQEFAAVTAKDGIAGLLEALRNHLDKFGASNNLTQATAN